VQAETSAAQRLNGLIMTRPSLHTSLYFLVADSLRQSRDADVAKSVTKPATRQSRNICPCRPVQAAALERDKRRGGRP